MKHLTSMVVYNFDRETPHGLNKYLDLQKTDSTLFKAVEREFDNWIESENPTSEYPEKYFGDDAIYTKKGAIIQGIEQIFEVMDEEKLDYIYLNDDRLDLACAFQD